MIFKVLSYIKFLFTSTNHHGVHSPFVFKLVTQCLYAKNNAKDVRAFTCYKKFHLKNKKAIKVTDFGAGSTIFRSNERPIHKIAKYAGISTKRAKLLMRVVSYFQSKNILEFGTSLGLATTALHLGNTESKIITLEGCPNTANEAKKLFQSYQLNNIQVTIGEFTNSLKRIENNDVFDLVYFDGNHQKQATLTYFEFCLQHIHNDSVFIFDDIHWSNDMEEAWRIIKNNPRVTVTIDTYQWGFVFFRKEQEKEHFIIRV
ncbi:MAG: class I SAM-dependent methyltransferase [Flavobacteriaceae bacterium]|nr:class I SAM-dependent methyltransferase [Flavobacteriaceae bacterium]